MPINMPITKKNIKLIIYPLYIMKYTFEHLSHNLHHNVIILQKYRYTLIIYVFLLHKNYSYRAHHV